MDDGFQFAIDGAILKLLGIDLTQKLQLFQLLLLSVLCVRQVPDRGLASRSARAPKSRAAEYRRKKCVAVIPGDRRFRKMD